MASFTAKMVRLVREDDYRRQMGETARQAAAEYDIERTTVMMEERYRNVIELAKNRKRSLRTRFDPLDGCDPAMKNTRQRLASWGEAYAAAYLQERGLPDH